jgi:bifunctional UDP-N-acetylglucosamine pyrophosphorylase/glucosamine-1-phosphate N-acetyltransferase
VRTLLLLAGRSKRFAPLEEKSLWPFFGKPLLTHQMERLKKGKCGEIVLVGGHHNLEEVDHLLPGTPSLEQENLDLGMRGALLSALPSCTGEPVCIVSGNDVVEPEAYERLVAASKKPGVDGAILAQRVRGYFPGGYLLTSPGEKGEHYVAGVVEKPGAGKEPSDLVNIVAHIHNHPEKLLDVLEDVSSATRDDAYEVALTQLCRELRYSVVPYEGRWDAIKYSWDVLSVTERFLGEIRPNSQFPIPNSQVHSSAVIEGPVILEEGVRVMSHATIQGPCYIGKHTTVGTGSLVRESIVGEHCVIGFGSEVARCNLHSHIWLHTTYLGDSVVGRNCAFGAGTITANFRLDEGEISSLVQDDKVPTGRTKFGAIIGSDVRVGINASFAPGVKVGKNVFINSGVFIDRDIPEGQYVKMREGSIETRPNTAKIPGIRA